MSDLPDRLRAIAESLENDLWVHPIMAKEDCLKAAEELERLAAVVEKLPRIVAGARTDRDGAGGDTRKTMSVDELQDLEHAVTILNRTDRGRNAMRHMLAWLDDDGLGLDGDGQVAARTLLNGAWDGWAGTARDLMRDALDCH